MATKSEEIKTVTIPVDIAFHITDHLEIPDMENWAEAVGMREQFRGKILEAKRMHKRIDESKDTSLPQVYFKFVVLEEHETLLELRYTSEGEFHDEHKWHISNLAQHLT